MAKSKTISVRRFDGGLDTVTDPELLPSSKTASAVNFSVEDTGGIRRRSGYLRLTPTALRSTPIKALYRWYDGDIPSWIAVTASAVLTRAEGVTDTFTNYEAEALSATGATLVPAEWASGGYSMRLTGTTQDYQVPLPRTTNVEVTVRSDVGLRWNVATTGGSWARVATSAVIAATAWATSASHTLRFIGPATGRGAHSLRLTASGGTGSQLENYAHRTITATAGDYFDVMFYDDITSTTDASRYAYIGARLGVNRSRSTTHYVSGDTVTPIARTTGWHTARFNIVNSTTAKTISIDGTPVTAAYGSYANSLRLGLDARGENVNSSAFFDAIRKNGSMYDDLTATSGWTLQRFIGYGSWALSATADTTTYSYIDLVKTAQTGSWVRTATHSALAAVFSFAQMNNKVYFGSDRDKIRSWDGSTLTASASWPAAAHLAVKQNRLFAAGKASDPNLVEYTEVDKPEDWTNGGALRLTATGSGGDVTGMVVWNDMLNVFGNSTTNVLYVRGNEIAWENREVNQRVGCIAPMSVAVTHNAVCFLSARGVYAYGTIPNVQSQDGSGFVYLSEDIETIIDRISDSSLACGMIYKGRYYLSVALDDAAYNTHTLVYRFADDEAPASWAMYDYGVSCFAQNVRGDEDALYGCDPTTGHICQLETGGSDDGANIVMRYKVPPLSAGSYAPITHFNKAYLLARSFTATQTLTCDWYNDDVSGATNSVDIGYSSDGKPYRIPVKARGRSLGVEFTTSGAEQDISISELVLVHDGGRLR